MDRLVSTIQLKVKRKFSLKSKRTIIIDAVKTHQRFVSNHAPYASSILIVHLCFSYDEAVPESNKWAACLEFRLELRGDKCPNLELTGTLQNDQDKPGDSQGMLEISVSRPSSNEAPLTPVICRLYSRRHQQGITLNPSFSVMTPGP